MLEPFVISSKKIKHAGERVRYDLIGALRCHECDVPIEPMYFQQGQPWDILCQTCANRSTGLDHWGCSIAYQGLEAKPLRYVFAECGPGSTSRRIIRYDAIAANQYRLWCDGLVSA